MNFKQALTLIIVFSLFLPTVSFAQQSGAGTANDFSMYVPYSGFYGYGSNMGYYGAQFTDQDVAQLAYNVGSRTLRLSLPDWLISGYGVTSRVSAFDYYKSIGMKDLVVFVGEPNVPGSNGVVGGPDNRETTVFPGTGERAKTFKGIYEPVWLDSAKTQINPANTFANYLYKTVTTYGSNIKFWEIVNEPDFTYSASGWQDKSSSSSWWNVNPSPNELGNLKAPIFYYIRELHVAWDVIKKIQPDAHIATGGIGYPSFLDALLRNTDNPVDGSVSSQYPLKGGAYFDTLSYHSYPMYSLRHWDNSIGNFVYTRYSDSAVDNFLQLKNDFQSDLTKYGYDGSTFPKKIWINTETDLPQASIQDVWGSLESANNYIMKVHLLAQANGISQVYKYGLGEIKNGDTFSVMGVYGDLSSPSTNISNAPKTEQFKVVQTLSKVLYGKTYDAAKTQSLNLPANISGVAFKDSNNLYTYALWAKTNIDKSEVASASYTFPFNFSGVREEADFSATNSSVNSGQTVSLTGTPSFFVENNSSAVNNNNFIPPQHQAPPINYFQPQYYNYVPPVTINFIPPSNPPPVTINNVASSTVTFVVKDKTAPLPNITVIVPVLKIRKTPGGKFLSNAFAGNTATVTDQKKISGVLWKKVIFNQSGIVGWVASSYTRPTK